MTKEGRVSAEAPPGPLASTGEVSLDGYRLTSLARRSSWPTTSWFSTPLFAALFEPIQL